MTTATKEQVARTAEKLTAQLRKLEKITGRADAKRSDADRKARDRARERDLTPPAIANLKRRLDKEADDAEWLRFYMGPIYTNPITDDRLENIRQIRYCAEYGVRKCIAAPRGSGKTTDFRYILLKDALSGVLPFAYLVSASSGKASESENALRDTIESAMPGSPLFDDYPFECSVIQEIARAPSRQHNATVHGMKLHCRWSHNQAIVFPSIRDPEANEELLWEHYHIKPNKLGAILCACGITSTMLQGSNVLNVRPSLIGIDDVDDRESTDIETGTMASKIENIIDKTIAGMSGQGSKPMGQVMLCTVPSRNSVAFLYSDPASKPAWDGVRIPRLKVWPVNRNLWDKYISLKQEGMQRLDDEKKPIDKFGRNAHQHYVDNREAMDLGAVAYDDKDYEAINLPDGSQKQLSAIQACFDYIAEVGLESFETEHQQNPPELPDILQNKVTGYHIGNCAGEYDRRVCDPTVEMVVGGIDVRKTEIHPVVLASESPIKHRIADYDIKTFGHGTETTVEQAEALILRALRKQAAEWKASPVVDLNGMRHAVDLCLVDCGWMGSYKTEDGTVKSWITQPVETLCLELGLRNWLPAKGENPYHTPQPKRGVIIGNNWHINRGSGAKRRCDQVVWNSAHFHLLVEELFMLDEDAPDRFELFLPDDDPHGIYSNHKAFSGHIVVGASEMKKQLNKGTQSRKPRFVRDHWWDSLAMALVAKSIESYYRERASKKRPKQSLADMQKAAT